MKKISLSIFGASCLALSALGAVSAPGTISVNSPSNSKSLYGNETISFSWVASSNATKYYYICDTNQSAIPASSSSKSTTTGTTGQCTPSSSGSYFVIVQGANASDETSAVSKSSSSLTVDVDNPVVSITKGTNGNGTVSITMSSTDTSNTNRTIYYTTDGSSPDKNSSTYSSELTFGVGTTVKAMAIDDADNNSTVATETFTISLNPTVKTTTDSTTLDGQTFATVSTNGATPKVSFTVGGDGFTRYRFKFDSDAWTTTEYNVSTVINGTSVTSLTEGSHELYVQAGDAYNFKTQPTTATATFTIDNTAPTSLKVLYDGNSTVTKVNPNLTSQNGQITLSATDTVTASSSLELRYAYGTNDAKTGTVYSSGFTLDTSTVSDGSEGTRKVNIAAKDAAGNWGTSSKTFTVDRKKPTLYMPSAQTFSTSLSGIVISFDDDGNTSTDDNGSIKYLVESASNGSCSTSKTITSLTSTYSSAITISGSSSQCLYAAALDQVGNQSDINSTLYTYSSTAPTLNLSLTSGSTFATVSTYGATPVTEINVSGNNFSSYKYEFDSNGTTTTADYNSTEGAVNSISLLSISEGDHNISVIGIGTDTNVTSSKTFTIDNTAPADYNSTSDSEFVDTNWTTSSSKSLSLTIPSDAKTLYYSLTSTSATSAGTFTSSSTSPVSVTISSSKKLWVKLSDAAGNENNVTYVTFNQNIPETSGTISAGWSMVSLPTGTIPTALTSANAIIWDYNGTAWRNNISGDSYTDFTSTAIGKGYWVKLTASTSVTYSGSDTSTLSTSSLSGWNLLGTSSEIATSSLSDVNTTWIYDSGIWKYHSNDSDMNTTLNSLGYQQLTTIPAYSGFWIYK